MPPGDEYAPLSGSGGGKLKLKGDKVSDGRIEKKKKKKEQKKKAAAESSANTTEGERDTTGEDNSLTRQREKEKDGSGGEGEREEEGRKESAGAGEILVGKTEAEKRYEEQRRKRLQDRLKREGVKTHKERVEELNKYLSRLTEHHDMYVLLSPSISVATGRDFVSDYDMIQAEDRPGLGGVGSSWNGIFFSLGFTLGQRGVFLLSC